jgi:hypothetical protein
MTTLRFIPASRNLLRATVVAATLFIIGGVAAPADAGPLLVGTPVTGATSTQNAAPAGYFDGQWIKYYIPLNTSTSGTYGVDLPLLSGTNLAGTIVDTGNGGSWLNMFIMFAPLPTEPVDTVKLRFEFKDLDLRYVNDPVGFFETVQLFNASTTSQFTPKLTMASTSQTAGYANTTTGRIDWDLRWTTGNSNAPVYLDVWGAGLLPYVLDESAFWVKLKFTVPDGVPYGTNTAEYLKATLTTTTQTRAVPEPTSMLLLGLGFVVLTSTRRLFQ